MFKAIRTFFDQEKTIRRVNHPLPVYRGNLCHADAPH